MKDIADQIEQGTAAACKTYAFDEKHDSTQPSQMWFQESREGLILFVVFYTQACRWSRCLGCNLPSKCSQYHVDCKSLMAQIDNVFSMPEVLGRREEIRKIIVSNNGSVLDQATFSSTALMYLVAKINLTIPHLSVLSIETRPEYVDLAELEFLKRGLDEGDTPTTLELAIGFEAFDERIRNEVFKKGLSLVTFESFVANLAPYKYAVKCYFMQKPVPEMTDEQAVRDVQLAIDHLSNTARKYGVELNMHLNPTYAAHSTPLAVSFSAGNYAPPRLIDVARAASYGRARGISIFIGLYDEGLAVPGGSFVRDGEDELLANLEIFNKTQDFDLLERLVRHHGKSTPLPKKI